MKKNYTQTYLLILALTVSIINIAYHFPEQNKYYTQAVEGAYYKQAKMICDNGFKGFTLIADNYLKKKQEHLRPNPLSIVNIVSAYIFLSFDDSYFSLSILSLFCFILIIIASYYYLLKLWDEKIAFFTTLLLCVAPLASAMAKRALSDTQIYLFFILTFFAFIDYIKNYSANKYYLFLCLLSISILVKVSSFFFLPFYILIQFIYYYQDNKTITLKQIAMTFIIPISFSGIVLFLFYGFKTIFKIFNVIYSLTIAQDFSIYYNAGPWYKFLIDYFLLSPFSTLLAILFIGYYLFYNQKTLQTNILCYFFIYNFVIFGFLPKTATYIIYFEFFFKIFAVFFILISFDKLSFHNIILYIKTFVLRFLPDLYKEIKSNSQITLSFLNIRLKNIAIFIIFFFLVFSDFTSFSKYFVKNDIFYPVTYKLLIVEKMIPKISKNPLNTGIDKHENIDLQKEINEIIFRILAHPTAQDYYLLGFKYYQAKQFEKSIESILKAIELKPDFAEAYNNLGSAYCEIKKWDDAIIACEKAISINPDFQLAKNNLNWAMSEKKAIDDNIRKEIENILNKLKSNPTAQDFYLLGFKYIQTKQFEKSIEANFKAIEINPRFADAYNNLGICYIEMKKWKMAINNFEIALKLKPDFQLARNNLNWTKSQIKN